MAVSGRPRKGESDARWREFLRFVASGESLRSAARRSGVDAERVLGMLEDRPTRTVVCALLDADLDVWLADAA